VTREKSGEATVLVRFLEQQVPVRLAFVPARPDFVWHAVAERKLHRSACLCQSPAAAGESFTCLH
jgi:hypothetical protein